MKTITYVRRGLEHNEAEFSASENSSEIDIDEYMDRVSNGETGPDILRWLETQVHTHREAKLKQRLEKRYDSFLCLWSHLQKLSADSSDALPGFYTDESRDKVDEIANAVIAYYLKLTGRHNASDVRPLLVSLYQLIEPYLLDWQEHHQNASNSNSSNGHVVREAMPLFDRMTKYYTTYLGETIPFHPSLLLTYNQHATTAARS